MIKEIGNEVIEIQISNSYIIEKLVLRNIVSCNDCKWFLLSDCIQKVSQIKELLPYGTNRSIVNGQIKRNKTKSLLCKVVYRDSKFLATYRLVDHNDYTVLMKFDVDAILLNSKKALMEYGSDLDVIDFETDRLAFYEYRTNVIMVNPALLYSHASRMYYFQGCELEDTIRIVMSHELAHSRDPELEEELAETELLVEEINKKSAELTSFSNVNELLNFKEQVKRYQEIEINREKRVTEIGARFVPTDLLKYYVMDANINIVGYYEDHQKQMQIIDAIIQEAELLQGLRDQLNGLRWLEKIVRFT